MLIQIPLIVRTARAGTMTMTVQSTDTRKIISTSGTITILCASTIRLRYTVRQAWTEKGMRTCVMTF